MDILSVKGLHVQYGSSTNKKFSYPDMLLKQKKCIAISGPIGSGKTTLLNALFSPAFVGQITCESAELFGEKLNFGKSSNFKNVSYMPQFAQDALNPYATVKQHITDVLIGNNKNVASHFKTVEETFEKLRLDSRILSHYPYQLSGGMKQRIVLALGFIKDPQLYVIDEPSTAIDPITLKIIIEFLKCKKEHGVSFLLVTHDKGMSAHLADEHYKLVGSNPSE